MGEEKQKSLSITGISIKDFLILEDVDLQKLDPRLNSFIGKNHMGKSSLLKAIRALFKGADASVIRKGADKTTIIGNLDHLEVMRTITRKGQRLKVWNTETKDIKASPQAFLDGLLSDFSFNPVGFLLLEGKDRTKYLRDLFSTTVTPDFIVDNITEVSPESLKTLDFSKDAFSLLKDAENIYYAQRTELNKHVGQKKALLDEAMSGLTQTPEWIAEVKDQSEELETAHNAINTELNDLQTTKKQVVGAQSLLARLNGKIKDAEESIRQIDSTRIIDIISEAEKRIRNIEEEIAALQKDLATQKEDLERAQKAKQAKAVYEKDIIDAKGTIADLPSGDLDAIDKLIQEKESDLHVNKIRKSQNADNLKLKQKYEEAVGYKKEYETLKGQSDAITRIIEKLRKDLPEKLTAEMQVPIEGLRFEGDRCFVNDFNIENMSTSEHVEFTVKVVEAFNKNMPLKMICIDDIEHLDDDTFAVFLNAVPSDYQLFLSMVFHEGQKVPENSLWVEKGKIKTTKGEN